MEVRCNEGLAIRIGPEPCAGVREGEGEASAGERIGQPLSRESFINLGADAVQKAEGDTGEGAMRVFVRPGVVGIGIGLMTPDQVHYGQAEQV